MANTPDDTLEAYIQGLLSEDSSSSSSVNGEFSGSNAKANQVEKITLVDAAKPDAVITPVASGEDTLIEHSEKTPRVKAGTLSLVEKHSLPKEVALLHSEPAPPPIAPNPQVEQNTQSQTIQEQVALLEEHKRQKLQEMLSQQALPQLKPAQVKAPPEEKTQVSSKVATPKPPVQLPNAEQEVKASVVLEQKSLQQENISLKQDARDASLVTDEPVGVYKILEWGANGRPIWAEGEFDALFFEVAGLTLAVPLVALGQIVNLNKKPTPLAGQSEWFMGMFSTSLGDLRTVNTALFVMPERYNPEFVNTAKFVISIDGLPWGLAVDKVNQPVRLKPEDVNWRSQRGKRPWLAGTVKSRMCALLDIPQMAKLLDQSDKNRRT
ncbi:hypothetical protein TDB9533_02180 [Thalassocella blandensis]|nr:hypothetical protein TDB9533_02180 [Thalassocella blandensis]